VQVDPMRPKLKPPGTKRLKLIKCDLLLSSFTFEFNLRRYTKMYLIAHATEEGIVIDLEPIEQGSELLLNGVGRCRLTVSNPVLKTPLVSALETTIS